MELPNNKKDDRLPAATKNNVRLMWILDGGKYVCFICSDELDIQHLQYGHVIPRNLGGNDLPNNLRLICSSCNTSNGCWKNMEEFIKDIDMFANKNNKNYPKMLELHNKDPNRYSHPNAYLYKGYIFLEITPGVYEPRNARIVGNGNDSVFDLASNINPKYFIDRTRLEKKTNERIKRAKKKKNKQKSKVKEENEKKTSQLDKRPFLISLIKYVYNDIDNDTFITYTDLKPHLSKLCAVLNNHGCDISEDKIYNSFTKLISVLVVEGYLYKPDRNLTRFRPTDSLIEILESTTTEYFDNL